MADLQRILSACDELARRFAERADQHDRAGTFPFENVSDLRAAGLPRLTIPREYGGDGATLKEMALVLQRLARGDASTALGVAMHAHILGQLAEYGAWPPAKYEEFCREVVARDLLVNSAASEPEMGSPSRGGYPATTAAPVDGGFLINGRKSWVTFAPALAYLLTSATIQSDAEFPDVGVFAVDSRAPGVRVLNNWSDALSLRASGSSEVLFSDVFVPAHWQVETRRHNDHPRGAALPPAWSACAFAAVYLGIGEAALEQFVAYARQRVPTALGKPITELPQTRRAIGQMDVTLRAARMALYAAAARWYECPDQRSAMTSDFVAAKFLCTNAAVTVTELALRSAGANGLDRKLPLERFFRDARAGLLHPPQDDLALEIMGRQVIDAG